MSSAVGTSNEVDTVQRSLSTGLPAWCSYRGVTCGTVSGSATYASVTSIMLVSLSLIGTIPSSIGSLTSLTERSKYCNDVNDPILLGIAPYRLLLERYKTRNDVNDPMLLGIVPANDRLPNESDVTLAYVADPLTIPHVTPR